MASLRMSGNVIRIHKGNAKNPPRMHLESCQILMNDAVHPPNYPDCRIHLGATMRTPDVQQTKNKCLKNVGRVHDVCIGQSTGTPRVYKVKYFGALCQSTSSFSLNCLHIPVLFAVLAAVAATAAITFPH